MEFGGSVRDVPAPRTLQQDASEFVVPVYSFAPQPRFQIAGHSTVRTGGVLEVLALSYSFFRDPSDLNAPVNFVDDIADIEHWIRKAEADDQPEWFRTALQQGRYPQAWEAVTTALDPDGLLTLEERLAQHVNHVLINTIPARAPRDADHIPRPDHAVTAHHVQPTTVTVQGKQVPGILIDTDPDIVGWALAIGDAHVSVALRRDWMNLLDPSLIPLTP